MELGKVVSILMLLGFAGAQNFTIDDCPNTIPHGRHLRVHGDSCFEFKTSTRRSWAVASMECEATQGKLVTIKDQATQDFLYQTLRHDIRYNGVVWIGLNDRLAEGKFTWTDGQPAGFTYWAAGQPGLLGGLEDCVGMDTTDHGRWGDYRCEGLLFLSSKHVFVCEYYLGKTTLATPSTTPSTTVPTAAPTTATSAAAANATMADDTTTAAAGVNATSQVV